ncbi:MAG: hypothetical protein V4719_09810, partial [Planctomycetota bacterium]
TQAMGSPDSRIWVSASEQEVSVFESPRFLFNLGEAIRDLILCPLFFIRKQFSVGNSDRQKNLRKSNEPQPLVRSAHPDSRIWATRREHYQFVTLIQGANLIICRSFDILVSAFVISLPQPHS